MRKSLDFNRTTWREFILSRRGHDQDRVERFEEVRMISYSSLRPYMDKNVSIQTFWPLPSDDKDVDEMKVSEAKKLMDAVTAKYKEFYNR